MSATHLAAESSRVAGRPAAQAGVLGTLSTVFRIWKNRRAFHRLGEMSDGTPSSRQSAAVRSEVGTPMTVSPPATFSARSRTNASAVEPVPMPSRMPSPTCASAARAASTFSSLAFMQAVPLFLPGS